MTTRFPIQCACGHEGAINMTENDPSSLQAWERYTPENLKGSEFYAEGGAGSVEDVFQQVQPVCPKCGAALSPSTLKQ
jgi:hypothetical protein